MTLVESLVSLVVLALGVLGLIGFQLQTLKDARDSVGRSRALVSIQDLSERMRMNQTSAAAYNTGFAPVAAPAVNCVANPCNSAQLAAFDLWRWKANIALALPGGQGAVAPSATDARQFVVMVAWRENQADAAAADVARTNPVQNPGAAIVGGTNGLVCPATFTCHLVYVQPFR